MALEVIDQTDQELYDERVILIFDQLSYDSFRKGLSNPHLFSCRNGRIGTLFWSNGVICYHG